MLYMYATAIFAFYFTPVSTNQQHLICKTVEDVFSESSHIPRNESAILQPAPCGNCQAAAAVDYAKIGELIDEKVALGNG